MANTTQAETSWDAVNQELARSERRASWAAWGSGVRAAAVAISLGLYWCGDVVGHMLLIFLILYCGMHSKRTADALFVQSGHRLGMIGIAKWRYPEDAGKQIDFFMWYDEVSPVLSHYYPDGSLTLGQLQHAF
jgi:hypothetical protein